MSIKEADVRSQPELYIIGKNFVRGTLVIFRQLASTGGISGDMNGDEKANVVWERDAAIDPNFFYQVRRGVH